VPLNNRVRYVYTANESRPIDTPPPPLFPSLVTGSARERGRAFFPACRTLFRVAVRDPPRPRLKLPCEGGRNEGKLESKILALTLPSARGVLQRGLMLFLPRGRARLSRLPRRVSISYPR